MGFGKFLIGGICAVGAVVAAPVVLPAAGLAIAAAPVTGAVGVSAGLAIATTSAATAGVVAGTAGVIAGDIMEDKEHREEKESMYRKGRRETADAYETKFKKQEEEFQKKVDVLKADSDKKDEIIEVYEEYIDKLEEMAEKGEGGSDIYSLIDKKKEELSKYMCA